MPIKLDENSMKVMSGVSSVDGSTPVAVVVDSVTNRLLVEEMASGSHGSVTNRGNAYRDGNGKTVMLGVSSDDDGTLVMPVVESGNLRLNND